MEWGSSTHNNARTVERTHLPNEKKKHKIMNRLKKRVGIASDFSGKLR